MLVLNRETVSRGRGRDDVTQRLGKTVGQVEAEFPAGKCALLCLKLAVCPRDRKACFHSTDDMA